MLIVFITTGRISTTKIGHNPALSFFGEMWGRLESSFGLDYKFFSATFTSNAVLNFGKGKVFSPLLLKGTWKSFLSNLRHKKFMSSYSWVIEMHSIHVHRHTRCVFLDMSQNEVMKP